MKKCPNCDREFDDAMRFCQTDGTPLVDAAPPVDPYKTMVARPEDIAAAIPPIAASAEPGPEPPAESEEVLDLPAADPKKTMYASEAEIREAMAEVDQPVVDLPPLGEPAPPAFIAPPESSSEVSDSGFSKTTPPIPSPFGAPSAEPELPSYEAPEPEPPAFAQPEPPAPSYNPFEHSAPEPSAPLAEAQFTPSPAAQDKSWQNEPMQNPQYQPGSAAPAAGGQNKTLAIISLVAGILGLTICCGWFLPSLLGVVLGFMAKGKANQNPGEYGGAGLATGGIITGALGIIGGIVAWILYVFYFAAIMATMPR